MKIRRNLIGIKFYHCNRKNDPIYKISGLNQNRDYIINWGDNYRCTYPIQDVEEFFEEKYWIKVKNENISIKTI